MIRRTVTLPELGLIAGTRGALGAGIALLLADRLAPYAAAGASWVIVGPIDASDPGNAPVLGEVRDRLNPPC